MVPDWSSVLWAGVAGGVAMELSAVVMRLLGFGRVSMVGYEGCMLTGRDAGAGSYLAGMARHLALSVLIAFPYAWASGLIWVKAGWPYGLMLAVSHRAVGGLVVPLMDRVSGCVRRGTVPPLRPFASGSRGGFFIFLAGHLGYGAVVGLLLGRA